MIGMDQYQFTRRHKWESWLEWPACRQNNWTTYLQEETSVIQTADDIHSVIDEKKLFAYFSR